MIFLDTNYFLRYLVQPTTPKLEAMAQTARALFRAVERGEEEVRKYLQALDLYVAHPKLGYADALVAASVEQLGIVLATFDSDFDGIPGITRWQPPTSQLDAGSMNDVATWLGPERGGGLCQPWWPCLV